MSKSKTPFIAAIDTQTLIWAMKRQGPADKVERARWLFEQLDVEKAQILIPALVVAEFLVKVAGKDHAATIEAIGKRFLVKPFDVESASLAAMLFIKGKAMRPQGVPLGREVLRSDALIVSTAKVHRASVFYSDDKDCRDLAADIMDARPLPINSPHLFGHPGSAKSKPK